MAEAPSESVPLKPPHKNIPKRFDRPSGTIVPVEQPPLSSDSYGTLAVNAAIHQLHSAEEFDERTERGYL